MQKDPKKDSVAGVVATTADGSVVDVSILKQRRFEAQLPLQKVGRMTRDQLLLFLKTVNTMLTSQETATLIRAAAELGVDMNSMLVRWQHETFEVIGVDRAFGVQNLSAVPANYPDDQTLHREIQRFQQNCSAAIEKATRHLYMAGEPETRRFPAAQRIQRDGRVKKEKMAEFIAAANSMLTSDATLLLLRNDSNGNISKANYLSIRWQRELFESIGVDQELGCNQISDETSYPDLVKPAALFRTNCNALMEKVMQSAGPAGERQFPAAEGKLHGPDDGRLSDDKLEELLTLVTGTP